MIASVLLAGLGGLAAAVSATSRLSAHALWVALIIYLLGTGFVILATLVGGFAGGWTILYPLPGHGLVWTLDAALAMYAGYLFVVVALGYLALWGGRAIGARRARRAHASWARFALFASGLAVIALAIMSPIGANDERLLSMHMVEHDLLIWVAAPLLALGGLPLVADSRQLPGALRRWLTFLARPVVAWTISTVLLWGWHSAPAYGLALSNEGVHVVEHTCLLFGSLLYWWPLIAPPPPRSEDCTAMPPGRGTFSRARCSRHSWER